MLAEKLYWEEETDGSWWLTNFSGDNDHATVEPGDNNTFRVWIYGLHFANITDFYISGYTEIMEVLSDIEKAFNLPALELNYL